MANCFFETHVHTLRGQLYNSSLDWSPNSWKSFPFHTFSTATRDWLANSVSSWREIHSSYDLLKLSILVCLVLRVLMTSNWRIKSSLEESKGWLTVISMCRTLYSKVCLWLPNFWRISWHNIELETNSLSHWNSWSEKNTSLRIVREPFARESPCCLWRPSPPLPKARYRKPDFSLLAWQHLVDSSWMQQWDGLMLGGENVHGEAYSCSC